MKSLARKLISVLLLSVFFLASGAGQLIHAAFHDHNYKIESNNGSSTLNSAHYYCTALQLMLPEFSGSSIANIPSKIIEQFRFYAQVEIAIPLLFSFKTSDRAPPVLA